MNRVVNFKTANGVCDVVCKRPSNADISNEELQKCQEKFFRTAYKIMIECKECLIKKGLQNQIKECGIDKI